MLPRDRALLLVAVGFLLVLNPVYAFPDGGHEEVRYTYAGEEVDYIPRTERTESGILDCYGQDSSEACAWAEHVGYDGSVRLSDDIALTDDRDFYYAYDFVVFDEGYARPKVRRENGTLTFSYVPVPEIRVKRFYAQPIAGTSSMTQQAVEEGTASTEWADRPDRGLAHVSTYEDTYINDDDTFYRLETTDVEYRRNIEPWQVKLIHGGGVALGILLVYVGRGRHALLVQEAEENDELTPRYPF